MKKLVVAALAACFLSAFAELPEGVIYRNDFTTRESSGAIPRLGEWYEATPYPTVNTRMLFDYTDEDVFKAYSALGFVLNGTYSYLNFAPFYAVNVNSTDARPCYDGWFQPYFTKGSATSTDAFYHQRAAVTRHDGNPAFYFWYSTTTGRRGVALHSLHNTFTNGQLKIQTDIRMPQWWGNAHQVYIFPVYDKYMDIEAWAGATDFATRMPGAFGVRGGSDRKRTYPMYCDVREGWDSGTAVSQIGNNYSGSGTSEKHVYWIRYEATYDLETARFSGSWKSLSGYMDYSYCTNTEKFVAMTHPTFDTETTTTKSSSFKNALWMKCSTNATGNLMTDLPALWQEKGGLSGLGITLGGTVGGSSYGENVMTNKVLVDNIRVSWKAPSAEDFAMVYENDFSRRTYRTLSGRNVATTGSYRTGEETVRTIDAFTGYKSGYSTKNEDGYNAYALTPTAVKPLGTTLQPDGVDGWRRLCPLSEYVNGRAWTSTNKGDAGAGGNRVEIGQDGHCGCFAQLIGESVTSGKVKLSVDVHVPARNASLTYRNADVQRIAVALGSTALQSSLTADIAGNTAAGGGAYLEWKKQEDGTNHVAFVYGPSATTVADPSTVLPFDQWMRVELVADMDTKTYDLSVTPLGSLSVTPDFVPTNDVLKTVTGIPFANDIAELGTFSVWGYGYGGTMNASQRYRTAFDNIRVWKISKPEEEGGLETATLIYSNDFSTRTRYLYAHKRASGRLAYQYDRDDGPDHWIRMNGAGAAYFDANATVRDDDGNAYLSVGRESGDGHRALYTTSLGTPVDSGKVQITADVRPPRFWYRYAGGAFTLALGNKTMEQHASLGFSSGYLMRFGFRDQTSKENGYRYADISPYALHSPDGTPVGTATGTYAYLCDTVDGEALKWYRFVARADLDQGTYKVSIYEMGADHPSADAPRGKLLGSVSGLHLLNPVGDGLSVLGVACYGISSTFGETGVDSLHALVDNIEVKQIDSGTVILVK